MAVKIGRTSVANHTPTLRIGERAPDIELQTHTGDAFSLAAQKGERNVVLAFYPAAFTGV